MECRSVQFWAHCFFLVYINDLPKPIQKNDFPVSLTDDTGILITSQNNIQFQNYLNIVFG